jgi:hypothetical protein
MRQEMLTSPIPQTVNATTLVADQSISRKAILGRVAAGAILGLAWGAALRAWMALLALKFGERPQVTWQGTFGAILLPAALMGAILGGAAYAVETSGRKRWRWALLSPLLLILGPAMATDNFISILVTTGMGGGAIGVALVGILGGFALAGFGALWLRWVSGLLALILVLASVGGSIFTTSQATTGTPNASDAFVGLLFFLLMALLTAGISAPFRHRTKQPVSE